MQAMLDMAVTRAMAATTAAVMAAEAGPTPAAMVAAGVVGAVAGEAMAVTDLRAAGVVGAVAEVGVVTTVRATAVAMTLRVMRVRIMVMAMGRHLPPGTKAMDMVRQVLQQQQLGLRVVG